MYNERVDFKPFQPSVRRWFLDRDENFLRVSSRSTEAKTEFEIREEIHHVASPSKLDSSFRESLSLFESRNEKKTGLIF